MNWKPGDEVIIAPAVSDAEAKSRYPGGGKASTSFLPVVPQP